MDSPIERQHSDMVVFPRRLKGYLPFLENLFLSLSLSLSVSLSRGSSNVITRRGLVYALLIGERNLILLC